MSEHVELRRGAYADSVTLMQVSRAASSTPGVEAALVAMATDLNLDVLTGMGFARPDGASPGDLLVALRAGGADSLAGGLATVEAELRRTGPSGSTGRTGEGAEAPRTTGKAAEGAAATLALVSVPGSHAFVEAMDALASGLHVMVFSDNVPVEQEVRLKDEGARRALLVMGPDCGTAVVGGVGLGFANVVRPGPVGIVASSGTGAQQVMCLLDAAGVGVSACLGVGGRDLSGPVGGRSTEQALRLLDDDPDTDLVVLVGKPPAAEVAERVQAVAAGLRTPVQLALLGPGRPDLTAAAAQAVRAVGAAWEQPHAWPAVAGRTPGQPTVRGLFSGGTLCDEAMVLVEEALGPVRSNIPLRPEDALPDDLRAAATLLIDFGDDRLTRGRPHPMIDLRSRLERITAETSDPTAGVLLLDVVLGSGAHPDPAAELAPALTAVREARHDLAVVVSLCGTESDPQGLTRQAEALSAAGAAVFRSNAQAARTAAALAGSAR